MGKIVWLMTTSLDGYMEGPGREIDWHMVDEELHTHLNDYLADMSAFLSGRVTWELMAEFWPAADEDPAAPEPIKRFAEIWRGMPKVVYSRSMPEGPTEHNATVVPEIVPAEVEALRATGDLVVGGPDVANEFLRLGLVDGLRIYVDPVLIGAGKPMFERRAFGPARLALRESRAFGNGVVLLDYEVLAPDPDAPAG